MTRKFSLTLFVIVIALGGVLIYQRFIRDDFNLPKGEAVPFEDTRALNSGELATPDGQIDDVRGQTQVIKSNRQIFVTDNVKHSIPLNEILSGGPPKDGIPAIDNPKFTSVFTSVQEASFLSDDSVGLGVIINGEARFYPYQILVWHEIANDTVQGEPILITYCPLCATGIVFERKIPSTGEIMTFGVSGRLWQSNLLMYNRTKAGQEQKESLWSQVLGEAVVGELTGDKLKIIRSDTVRFTDWKRLHPNTKVLSTDTGFNRSYGSDPYGDYYTDADTIFPTLGNDDRLFSKAFVLGVEINGKFKAYESGAVARESIVNDVVGGTPLLVIRDTTTNTDIQASGVVRMFERIVGGSAFSFELRNNKLLDIKTGSEWSFDGVAVAGLLKGTSLTPIQYTPGFWFSWVAVHPQTELFK